MLAMAEAAVPSAAMLQAETMMARAPQQSGMTNTVCDIVGQYAEVTRHDGIYCGARLLALHTKMSAATPPALGAMEPDYASLLILLYYTSQARHYCVRSHVAWVGPAETCHHTRA